MIDSLPTYRYLNLEESWPGFRLQRLEVVASGVLRLAALPGFGGDSSGAAVIAPLLRGPAGIGVDRAGLLYVADVAGHRILQVACDGSIEPLACLRGPGAEPGALNNPRGVLVGRHETLYVADSGNRRIQAFDLLTHQLRGLWERGFEEPWDLAEDSQGRVFVADPGKRREDGTWERGRVVRLGEHGLIDPGYVLKGIVPGAPTSVAIIQVAEGAEATERLLVLDAQPSRLLVYHLDGNLDRSATNQWSTVAAVVELPGSLRSGTGGAVHLTDLSSGRILSFSRTGEFLGVAHGQEFEAGGLAIDCDGRLVATAGAGSAIRQSLGLPAFVQSGAFLAGPYEADTEPTRWQRIQLDVDELPPGAHFRLWTLTSDDPTLQPSIPVDPDAVQPPSFDEPESPALTALGVWRALPWDAPDALILNQPGRRLWIAGTLIGSGRGSPAIRQMRLIHDEDGWLRYLPALFSRDDTTRAFLERALALFETLHERERVMVDDLPLLFDAQAAPDRSGASWLEWLADWVGTELDQTWDVRTRRDTVAGAFRFFATRGTPLSLRRIAELYARADIQIEEEGLGPGLWGLGAPGSGLGFDTALAPLAPDGAVLDVSSVVNGSTLEREPACGRPAFEVTAHRFLVRVHAALVGRPGQLERLRRVIEREKPAHMAFHLCVIQPAMRVGAQARLGIDTVVAGPPTGGAFDPGRALGTTSIMPTPRRRLPARLGAEFDSGRVPVTLG